MSGKTADIDQQISQIEDSILETDFQYDFFYSLKEQWDEKQYLSARQIECLEKIYERVI